MNRSMTFILPVAEAVISLALLAGCSDKSTSSDHILPSTITSLSVVSRTATTVTLTWTSPGDDTTSGRASQYDIRYATNPINDTTWNNAIQASGEPAPLAAGVSDTFTVTGLLWNTLYYFAMKTADEARNWSGLSNTVNDNTPTGTWQSLGAGLDGFVSDLEIYQGRVIAGGGFNNAGGSPANKIAAWDGLSWSALGSGINSSVIALAVFNGKLIAGGQFQTAGGIPVNNIAAWDGNSWLSMGNGLNDKITSLAVYNNRLYAGGHFTASGSDSMKYVAYWDGDSWHSLGQGPDGYVFCLEVYNNILFVGGLFGHAGGSVASNLAGFYNGLWSPNMGGPNGMCTAMKTFDGKLVIGGEFSQVGGVAVTNIACWNGISWSDMSTALNDPGIRELGIYQNHLIASGSFGVAMGPFRIAVWTSPSWWRNVGNSSGPNNNSIDALIEYNGRLIAGGDFTRIGSIMASNIASWGD